MSSEAPKPLTLLVKSEYSLTRAFAAIRAYQRPCKIVVALISPSRSNPQNALLHMWIPIIAQATGETPDEAKSRIKLDIGVPILLAENPSFAALWGPHIAQPREVQLELLSPPKRKTDFGIPVTSKMTKNQFTRLLELVEVEHADFNIMLPHPDDVYNAAMGRRRKK